VSESERRSSVITDDGDLFGEATDNALSAQNVEYVGHIGGSTEAIFVQGNYAYIGVGPRLTILDITNPTSPTVVGKTAPMPGIVPDIYVDDNYAYLAAYQDGLRVVDIEDPTNPTEVGFYDSPGEARGVYVSGNYAYLADGFNGLRVVDIEDPTNPTEVGFYDSPGRASGVYLSGNYAYLADESEGLRVVDISTPTSPTEVGFYDSPGSASGVTVSGNYAYLADGSEGLRVVDISTPTSPTEVGFYNSPGDAVGVTVSGHYAYLADHLEGLRVVDIEKPGSPTEVGFYDSPGYAEKVTVSGHYAYLANDWNGGLRVVDIEDPTSPTKVGFYDSPGKAERVTVSGNYAYLASGNRGLRVVDISTPTSPTEVGFYDSPGDTYDVYVSGNYAYLADYHRGLRVVDISNPTSPTEVGFYNPPGYVYGVTVSGNYAYLTDFINKKLRVVDISTPTSPTEVGSLSRSAYSVTVSGNYAYLADDDAGLRVVDISNPTSPTEVGFYDSPGSAWGVTVSGNYAYLADGTGGLRVVDISTPSSPTEVGFYDSPGYARSVYLSGNYAYLAGYSGGLRVMNISNPGSPTEVGFYNSPGSALDVYLSGNHAYLADLSGGLFILQFTGGEQTPTPTASHTPTMSATHTPTASHTPTMSATDTPTPSNTPTPAAATNTPVLPTVTAVSTPVPGDGDAYELDDACEDAQPITTDGMQQVHFFHQVAEGADSDWVSFQVQAGSEYLIEARTPPESQADVVLELYDDCDGVATEAQDYTFSPDIRLQLTAPADGSFYLKLLNHSPSVAGPQASYHLSVRELKNEAQPGALILVAGRLRENDRLQPNIYHVTDAVYDLFERYDYGDERIHYLAPELRTNVDGLVSAESLEAAITEWAVGQEVGPDRALTLYIMDHGSYDTLYLDKPRGEWVTPAEINEWLDTLEAARPGVRVNVIIEACYSGSFVDLTETVSAPGRVVITSTGAEELAWASEEGAVFSDHFITALQQGQSLHASFESASWAAKEAHPAQKPWLEDEGNSQANQSDDGQEAARRGFAFPGTFAEVWQPYIVEAGISGSISNGSGVIEVQVQDDRSVRRVWAVIYPPDYEPPSQAEELVQDQDIVPTLVLRDQGNHQYAATFTGFNQMGNYRIVIYAEDNDQYEARPHSFLVQTSHQLYLPSVMR